jgi:hypothetical protein
VAFIAIHILLLFFVRIHYLKVFYDEKLRTSALWSITFRKD